MSASGVGINADTLDLVYNNFTVGDSLWLMTVGGLLMFVIGLYLDNVLPKAYGVRKNPCFCITCGFSLLNPARHKRKVKPFSEIEERNHELKYLKNPEAYEDVPPEIQ